MSGLAHHPSLSRGPADLIAGEWRSLESGAGERIVSTNPAHPSRVVWQGVDNPSHVDAAVAAARSAFAEWSNWPFEKRVGVLRAFQRIAKSREAALTELLRDEIGKATWDSKGEAGLLSGKVDITLDDSEHGAMRRVSAFDVAVGPTRAGRAWFKPHGVMAVLGPFNFPMHLPNGHIIPALAMGNTIVFKPSDKTPACGQALAEMYHDALVEAGAPRGVVNLVQGGAKVAASLASHRDIDGVLFTGSWDVGRRIMQANLDHPGRILALEMGGNNPAIVMDDADLRQALVEIVRCAFVTSGQRCTCTRRVIVHERVADRFIGALVESAKRLVVGDPATEGTFMGPVVAKGARDGILHAFESLVKAGAKALLSCEARTIDAKDNGWYVSPGILRVDRFTKNADIATPGGGADVEVFGPLLRVSVVKTLDEAIEQANATSFGLAASIFTHKQSSIEQFLRDTRAGCLNVNTGTAGASSKLPFGGLGHSGNHRPAGAFSLDYCAYPIAGMTETGAASTMAPGMTIDDAWLKG
ncbi:MAG: aldehyde dehydrogenase family protein [Phycisphaerales bacterium]